MLVTQNLRERKGSFFTPQIWVELSQKYLTDVLGEDWQDEYYIWDCAAGTGNLLTGLTNKCNIWASTLDTQDVEVMKDRIKNGANLLEEHVFQFDFLNDDFSKLPLPLQKIINDPKKRRKLVIYINPPYAEATDGIGKGGRKLDVSKETMIYSKYGDILKKAKNELFAQFFIRVYKEVDSCILAQFSKLKHLHSPNFSNFRSVFLAKLEKMFIVPANTFDNVEGKFPISFIIWNTKIKEAFSYSISKVYDENGLCIQEKLISVYNGQGYINNWIKIYSSYKDNFIGYLAFSANDFQHNSEVRICYNKPISHISTIEIKRTNIKPSSIYLTVRHCIEPTWINDRDQFLYPNDGWKDDSEFQNDCLAYALFHSQNRITSQEGTNHWIPFTEYEVGAREKFDSNFMTNFIQGKLKKESNGTLLDSENPRTTPLVFSAEAKAVFDAGRELWRYYHSQEFPSSGGVSEGQGGFNVNASLYDIREFFQGRNAKGKMNNRSDDENYTELIGDLRDKLKLLAKKIEPKVYEYGFLKG